MARSHPFRGDEIIQGKPEDVFPNHREWIQHIKSSDTKLRPFRTLTTKERAIQRERLHEYRRRCLKYRKYRDPGGTAKTSGNLAREQKWPPHFEAVFWEALLEHPPRLRQKQQIRSGDKQMGRNELIAEYMMKHLPKREMEAALIDPKSQPRKFVSSHLQVLRGKFASIVYTVGNQDYTDYFYFGEVLLWLGPTEGGKSGKPKKRQGPDWNSELMEHFFPGHWDSVRNRTTNHQEVQPCIELAPSRFEPEFFSMRLQRSANDGSRASTTLITQSASSGTWLPELQLENLTDWQCLNPRLFAPYGKKRLPSNIVSGEVSLTIPNRNNLKGDTRLIIEDIFTAAGSVTGECHARTRIYVDNEHVFTPNPRVESYGSEGRLYHQPQFGADPFWQRQIAGSMVSDQVRSRIRRIVTVQELFEIKPKDEDQVPDLLVYWTFSVAPPDTPGSTRFRRIIPPAEVMSTSRQYGQVKAGAQDISYDNVASTANPYGYYRDGSFEMEIDTRTAESGALLYASQGSSYALSPFDLNDNTSLQTTIGWQQSRDNPSIGQLEDSTPTVASFPLGTSAAESFPINAGLTEDNSVQLFDPELLHDAGSMPSAQYPRYGLKSSSHPSWPHAAAMLGESEYMTPGLSSQEPSQPHQAQCNTSFGGYSNLFQDKDVENVFDMPKAAWHQKPHVESLRSTQNGYFATHYLASQPEERPNKVTNDEDFNAKHASRSPSRASVDPGTAQNFPYYPVNDRSNLQNLQSHVNQPMVPAAHDYGTRQQQQQQQSQAQNEQSHQQHLYPAPTLPSMPSISSETLPHQMNLTPSQPEYFVEAQHVHSNPSKQQERPPQHFRHESMDNLSGQRECIEEPASHPVESYGHCDNNSVASTRSIVEMARRHSDEPQQQARQSAHHGSFESAFETPRQDIIPYPSRILDYEPHHPQAYHEPQAIDHAPQASLAVQQEASPQSTSTPSTLAYPQLASQQQVENDPQSCQGNADAQKHALQPSSSAAAVQQLEPFDPTTCWDDIATTASASASTASPPATQAGAEEGAKLVEANVHAELFEQRQLAEWEQPGGAHEQHSPTFAAAGGDIQASSVEPEHGEVGNTWDMAKHACPSRAQPPQSYAQMSTYHHHPGETEDLSPTTKNNPADVGAGAGAGTDGWVYVQNGVASGSGVSSFEDFEHANQRLEVRREFPRAREDPAMRGSPGGEEGEWVDAWTAGGQRQHQGRQQDDE